MTRNGLIGKPEDYKGLTLAFWRDVWGYEVRIYDKNVYLVGQINTYEKTKKGARKVAQDYVRNELFSFQRKSRKQGEKYQRDLTQKHSNR